MKSLLLALILIGTAIPGAAQQPHPSRSATVIFYRRGGVWSKALDFPISLDGHTVGTVHNGIYIRVSTTPGEHEVAAGGSLLTQGETVSLKTEVDKTYYVRIDNAKGMHEHVAMKLVSPKAAMKDLSKLKELRPQKLND